MASMGNFADPICVFERDKWCDSTILVQESENASEVDIDAEALADGKSFKESFYSSGTDWSSLYELDEYGMPREQSDPDNDGILMVRNDACRAKTSTKLVQASLSAYVTCGPKEGLRMDLNCAMRQTKFATAEAAILKSVKRERVVQEDLSTSIKRKREPRLSRNPIISREKQMVPEPNVRRPCPFYKKIPGTSFVVDAFRYGQVDGCTGYFLTHFHSDHYGGLTRRWSNGVIYCSNVTAQLLDTCLSIDARWIFPLQLGVMKVIEGVEVTLLEANHCPGAAIIFFKLPNKQTVLHTGDFRASRDMQNYKEFLSSPINVLFLDTTYCNPRYRFPCQKAVINFAIRVSENALAKCPKTLIVVGAYSIGKEHVYLGIAKALKVNFFVERRRAKLLSVLQWPELADRMSMNPSSTLLHVLPIGSLKPEKLKAYMQNLQYDRVLAFRPTGWAYSEKVGDDLGLLKPQTDGPTTIYGIPYSEHSSYVELREFVQFLQPGKIIPTVNNGSAKERDRMQSLFRSWSTT